MDLSPGETRQPEPGLESAIFAGKRGEATSVDVLRIFAQWPMLVPSSTDSGTGAPFTPVILESHGTPLVAVYTSPDLMVPVAEVAPFWTTYSGLAVLKAVNAGAGVVINAGSDFGMELAADVIPAMIAELEGMDDTDLPVFGEPQTLLEHAIISHAMGQTSDAEALAVLGESDVFVPSATSVEKFMNEISPVSFSRGGKPYVAVYSRAEFIREPVSQGAAYIVQLPAGAFSRVIGNGAGLIVSPGTGFEFRVEAEALAGLG